MPFRVLRSRVAPTFIHIALGVIALTVFGGESPAAQSSMSAIHSMLWQESAPRLVSHPRIDVGAGMTSVNLHKLPTDSRVGGFPAGLFFRAGYAWTQHLATHVELVSQAEAWNPDYAFEYVVRSVGLGGRELKTVQLKHNYDAGRWTVAQAFQFGTRIRPYVGGGVGIEYQAIHDSRLESSRLLLQGETPPPNAKDVDELPTEFPAPTKTRFTIMFAEAGVKVFMARRVYGLVSGKFTNGHRALISLGLGVELF